MCYQDDLQTKDDLARELAIDIRLGNNFCNDTNKPKYSNRNYLRCLLRKYRQCIKCNDDQLKKIYDLARNKYKGIVDKQCNWTTGGLLYFDDYIDCYYQEEGEALGYPNLVKSFHNDDVFWFVYDNFYNATYDFNKSCQLYKQVSPIEFNRVHCARSLVIQSCQKNSTCEAYFYDSIGAYDVCIPGMYKWKMENFVVEVFNEFLGTNENASFAFFLSHDGMKKSHRNPFNIPKQTTKSFNHIESTSTNIPTSTKNGLFDFITPNDTLTGTTKNISETYFNSTEPTTEIFNDTLITTENSTIFSTNTTVEPSTTKTLRDVYDKRACLILFFTVFILFLNCWNLKYKLSSKKFWFIFMLCFLSIIGQIIVY